MSFIPLIKKDLMGLSDKIERPDGKKLKICHPPTPPDPLEGILGNLAVQTRGFAPRCLSINSFCR